MEINPHEKLLLEFLYNVYRSGGPTSFVAIVYEGGGDEIMEIAHPGAPNDLSVEAARSLAADGYIQFEPTNPDARGAYYISILQKGRELAERRYVEVPTAGSPGHQILNFIGSTITGAAFTNTGNATLSDTTVNQGAHALDDLLAQMIDKLNASHLSPDEKVEAIGEVQQLAIEAHKTKPQPQRLRDSLVRLGQLGSGLAGFAKLIEMAHNHLPGISPRMKSAAPLSACLSAAQSMPLLSGR